MKEIKLFAENSLQEVKKSNLLSTKDMKDLASLIPDLQKGFSEDRMYRTELEMRFSVLDDMNHPTLEAKHQQARREQSSFFYNIAQEGIEYRKVVGEIKLQEAEIAVLEEEFKAKATEPRRAVIEAKIELIHIEIDSLSLRLFGLKKSGAHRMRELRAWDKILRELESAMPKDFDAKKHSKNQLVGYFERYRKEIKAYTESGDTASGGLKNTIANFETLVRVVTKLTPAEIVEKHGIEGEKPDFIVSKHFHSCVAEAQNGFDFQEINPED